MDEAREVQPERSLLQRISDPLLGPEPTEAELGLGWSAALFAAIAQFLWALRAGEWSLLQTIIAVVFAFDIGGGVVVNASRSARRWWHRPGQGIGQHLTFFVAHIHPFVVAALWPGFDWWQAAALYVSMLVAATIVLIAPGYLKRPVSFALGAIGIILAVAWLGAPAGLVWLPPLYFIKLVMAHAVSNE